MQGKKKTSIGPLIFRIALIVLCMTAFSTSMLSGLYARYTAKNNGEDSARVAKFDVTAKWSEDVTVDASLGQTNGEYKFTVTNNSEVAITYDLVLTFEGGIPAYLQASLPGKEASVSGNTITFSKVASLAPSTTGTQHTLTFTMDLEKFTQPATGESYEETLTFTATIRCTQID